MFKETSGSVNALHSPCLKTEGRAQGASRSFLLFLHSSATHLWPLLQTNTAPGGCTTKAALQSMFITSPGFILPEKLSGVNISA